MAASRAVTDSGPASTDADPSSMYPIERRDAETDRVSQNNLKACEPPEGPRPARVLRGAHEGVSHCAAKMGSMEATTPATCIRRHLGETRSQQCQRRGCANGGASLQSRWGRQ